MPRLVAVGDLVRITSTGEILEVTESNIVDIDIALQAMWGNPRRMPMADPVIRPDINEFEDLDFYCEPIKAWRCWKILERPHGLQLQSITQQWPWPIRKPMRAHCVTQLKGMIPEGVGPHFAPNAQHSCGIYGVKTKEQAFQWKTSRNTVLMGEVNLWGRVNIFTEGYLAEYAYPINLISFEAEGSEKREMAHEVAARYCIPVIDKEHSFGI